MLNIVLLEPEIPLNTGNIGRTCAATNTALHLIRPYGFIIDSKYIKRSGMDYWDLIKLYEYDNFDEFLNKNKNANVYMCTTKAQKIYTDVKFNNNDFLMFGKESKGIPEEILLKNQQNCIRIPMASDARSLNLSNSAAIVLYEALRQLNFNSLEKFGQLHDNSWND